MTHILILDIDGTLVDSNDAHAHAWEQAFHAQDIKMPFDRIRPLIGMGGDQLVPTLTGINEGDPRFSELSHGWQTAFENLLPQVQPFEGTRELITLAQQAGWKVVVATSGEAELAARLLKLAQVDDLLPDRISNSDVQASKPQPDLMHAALAKVGGQPQDAWMLGDTSFDVAAAHKAGIKCAVVRLGGNPDPEDADLIFDDLNAAQNLFLH